MCGIIGFISFLAIYKVAFEGICMLQNRGYDSAGICTLSDNNELVITKYASRENISAINLLKKKLSSHKNNKIGILHTRWATHGNKTDINAHPHCDFKNEIALVHNGIIENFYELKKDLEDNYGIKFISQTDTEVIVNLISVYFDKYGNMVDAIKETQKRMCGTWAIIVIHKNEPNTLYCVRHGSPLLMGFSHGFYENNEYIILASEQIGFGNKCSDYICLKDDDIIVLHKKDNHITFEKKLAYKNDLRKLSEIIISSDPSPYPHWMIREIFEQPESSTRSINLGSRILDDYNVKLGGLEPYTEILLNYDHCILLGCGTSYHSALYVSNIFKIICDFSTILTIDASDFTEFDIPKHGKTILILVSQSGETKDLIQCMTIGKSHNLFMIGVTNVVDSFIAREVNCGVYLNAGREMAVASTKSFTSQIIVLVLVAIWFSQIKNVHKKKRKEIIESLRKLSDNIKKILYDEEIKKFCNDVAHYLLDKPGCFILGKLSSLAIAKECCLKLKEIGYIQAESYSSSALKHGPYSLLIPHFPVIMLIPNDIYFLRNDSVVEELKSRESFVIGISDIDLLKQKYNMSCKIISDKYFGDYFPALLFQLISYELGILKKTNPDFPKNLAKCVTVH